MSSLRLTSRQARMLAIRSQGFRQADDHCVPTGWRQMKSSLISMGALQIDAINTVIRSHYTPLYSRLGPYDRTILDKHLFAVNKNPSKRSFFEYWGHECSVLPIELYPLFRWRMDDAKKGVGIYKQLQQMARDKPSFVASVKAQLHQNPMSCRELGPDRRGPGMWEWSESKQALEYLFSTGEVASLGRRGFERVYALAQDTIPSALLNETGIERIEAQACLIELAAKALGVATEADLRDYFRLSAVDGKAAIARLLAQGRLLETTVEGWTKPAYLLPKTTLPRQAPASTLLTPFDPLVWNRDRAKRLFDFDYKIEIYVPSEKRRFGYWVMPFLHQGNIVARVDLKADRDAGLLIVKGAWSEPHQHHDDIVPPLARELERLASWLGLAGCSVGKKGDLAKHLRKYT
ncbi:MAG: winged helix DNA-binding domain-containing protein [Granulosicoccus sp.]|nr:winged helix DNA-binding domain-containing protein [Granulosicoccus sp.]